MSVVDKGIQYDNSGKYIGNLYVVDGVQLYVCYPQNGSLNGNVQATFFWPGASASSGYRQSGATYVNYFVENNQNQLLISTEYNVNNYHGNVSNTMNAANTLIDYLETTNGININIDTVASSSAGGYPSTRQMLELLKSEYKTNTYIPQKSLNLYDPYSSSDSYLYEFSNEDIEVLKKNDTQVTFFTISDRMRLINRPNTEVGRTLKSLTDNGIDTVVIYGDGYEHNATLKVPKEDGWFDYQNGLIGLSDIKNSTRNYKIVLNKDGEWKTYKLSDIVGARNDPSKYGSQAQELLEAGEKLDSMYVRLDYDCLNEVSSLSSIWQNIIPKLNMSWSSTSSLLPQEQTAIINMDKAVDSLQNLFSKEISKIEQAGNDYLKMENELAAATNVLNNNLSLGVTIQILKEATTLEKVEEETKRVVPKYNQSVLANKNVREPLVELTGDDLNKLFEYWAQKTGNYNSPLRGKGEAFIEAAKANNLDPLLLIGICGIETGKGGKNAMGYMRNNNFFGMDYIDPHGNGKSVRYASKNHLYDTAEESIMDCARRISEFYVDKHGATTAYKFGPVGYAGPNNTAYGNKVAAIMKESLDYILENDGKEIVYGPAPTNLSSGSQSTSDSGSYSSTSYSPSTPSYSGTAPSYSTPTRTQPSAPKPTTETPKPVVEEPKPVVEVPTKPETPVQKPVDTIETPAIQEPEKEIVVPVSKPVEEPIRPIQTHVEPTVQKIEPTPAVTKPSKQVSIKPYSKPTVDTPIQEPEQIINEPIIEDSPMVEEPIIIDKELEDYALDDFTYVEEPAQEVVIPEEPIQTEEPTKVSNSAAKIMAGLGLTAGAAALGYTIYKKSKEDEDDGGEE